VDNLDEEPWIPLARN